MAIQPSSQFGYQREEHRKALSRRKRNRKVRIKCLTARLATGLAVDTDMRTKAQ